jgi:hypothetical protein
VSNPNPEASLPFKARGSWHAKKENPHLPFAVSPCHRPIPITLHIPTTAYTTTNDNPRKRDQTRSKENKLPAHQIRRRTKQPEFEKERNRSQGMNREEETLGFYEMGNSESRIEEEEEEDSQQSPHHDSNVVSAGGALLDEQEVIHYAAAAERLLASHSMASSNAGAVVPSKKAKRKKGAHKDEQPLPIAPPPPAPYRGEMSVASAVAAAAAALKEREIQAKATTSTTAPEASASTVPDGGEEGKTEVTEKRKRRKKKQRQTSQEEESAQALLALNKGGLGSSGGVDSAENENAIIDEDDVAAVAEPSTPSKKGKKKKRSKKQPLSEEMVIDEDVEEEASLLKNTNGDAEMADEFAGQFVDASSTAAATTDIAVVPGGVAGNVTTIAPIDQAGLPHLDIPDQRIITEHLAAHMAKIPSASGEDMMVEQRLISELQGIHPTALGTDGFTASTPNGDGDLSHQLLGPTPSSRSVPRKRKRDLPNNTTQLNGLVDPQLMQIDEEAALAAGDGDTRKRKRRTAQPVGFVEGAEVTNNIHSEPAANVETATVTVATENQNTVAQQKVNSWGSTTVNSTGDPPNGGTFSLEERFAIDKALQDYSKIHGMTMDELKDRVWGNNRKKDEFWDFISSAVPNRSRASVYKHVRRSCHIFQQRAKWTPEEDAELDALVKEKGNKWKDIGEAMGRMGEDCRDRYRNYVKCGDDRGKDRWSEEEEELLKKTVREHKENTRQILIQQGKPLPSPEEEDSVLINWTTVSEMMKNRRSRIQCRYKWKKMLAQKEKVKQAPIGVTYVGGKKKRISFDIEKMKPGDKQWLLHL